jgi:hypothetical protein
VYPFKYGKDFRPNMPNEEIEYLNKAVIVQMEERSKADKYI